ncbi:diguanylate cyclase domain-containing protein, partial [Escherichia coli]|nr:diguanylate cyclase [Escherichia coli]MEC4934633.1 diguanylate cyclase [Escherichia coli]MEC4945196.1 diguanylate cyclase [Escherichia coli]MEC4955515.1 diguanylate cyclase [Escherichia coli]MEC4971180.1 diguanylate cyclase [Escherichia coli]
SVTAWTVTSEKRHLHRILNRLQICSALTQIFNLPFDLHNGHQTTMTLSIGYAMTIEHASAEKLQELADHNMYQAKHQRAEKLVR